MTSNAGAPEPLITMTLYAHVHAALAERLPLGEILEHEGVTPARWEKAELAFRKKIASDVEAQADYEVALVEAEGKFARTIKPVDRDVAAWLALLDAYAAAPAPFAFLTKLGLRQTDLGRLRRAWTQRISAEPELEAKIAELRKGKLGPLPPLEIGPAPFVSSSGVARPATGATSGQAELAAAEIEGVGVDRLAALGAEIGRAPAREADAIRARYGLDRVQHEALLARFSEAFLRDPSLERDYRRLFAHHEQRLRAAAAARDSSSARPPASPARDASATGSGAPVEATPALDASDLARALGARLSKQGLSLRGTALAPAASAAPALPFSRPPPPAPPPPTGLASSVAPPLPERKKTSIHSGTALAVDAQRSAALPFAPSRSPAPRERPQLTVEQYASLRVELDGAPERRDEVLARYGLGAADKQAIDADFEARFEASPTLKTEWLRACDAYRAWLASRRR